MANFPKLLRFVARRERAAGLAWVLGMVLSAVLIAAAYPGLMPDEATLRGMMAMMQTPAMAAMMGPVYGLEAPTQAGAMAQECLVWFLLAAAIMNILLVSRNTRRDEELGRQEMLAALPAGRAAGAAAALAFSFLLNFSIAVLTALGLLAGHIGGTTAAGAFVYGGAVGAAGFFFAGLTLLCAQILSTSRGVTGLGMTFAGLFYAMRASGDVSGGALSLLSPFGLALRVEAFYRNNFLPVLVLLLAGALLAALALLLCARRDLGLGLVPARKGKARASRLLQSPLGLAWRLTRGTALWWAAALLAVGGMYGSVVGQIESFAAGNELVAQLMASMGGGSMTQQYVAMLFGIMGILCAVPCALTVLRLYKEEKRGRLEQVLACGVRRAPLLLGFALVAFCESFAALFAAAAGLSLASGGSIGFAATLRAAFAYLPALWVITGLAVLLCGALPKFSSLVWAAVVYSFAAVYLGMLLRFPAWTKQLTPFGHIPKLPIEALTPAPLLILTGIAAALAALGVWRYRARDIG